MICTCSCVFIFLMYYIWDNVHFFVAGTSVFLCLRLIKGRCVPHYIIPFVTWEITSLNHIKIFFDVMEGAFISLCTEPPWSCWPSHQVLSVPPRRNVCLNFFYKTKWSNSTSKRTWTSLHWIICIISWLLQENMSHYFCNCTRELFCFTNPTFLILMLIECLVIY